jgi:hypothetical protein
VTIWKEEITREAVRYGSFLNQLNNPEELARSMVITEGAETELEEIDQRNENQNIVNKQQEKLVLDSAFIGFQYYEMSF